MKKLFILISILISFALTLGAQDVSKTLGTNASNITYLGDDSDTITNTDSWVMEFNLAAKNKRQGYHLKVHQDSISGTPTTAAVLSGSDDGVTKITIATVSWTGTTADTTYYFNDVGTGVLYRHLFLTITGTGTQKSKVYSVYGKIGDL